MAHLISDAPKNWQVYTFLLLKDQMKRKIFCYIRTYQPGH